MLGNLSVVGDLHLTHKTINKAEDLFGILEALGDPVVWLGDLLDTKEVIRGKCQNALFDYFKRSKLQHTVVVGNHDWFNLECLDHSLKVYSALPNVKIIDKMEYLHNIFFIPYYHDKAKIKEVLAQIPDGSVIIGHFDISGFDFGNGHLCEDGLKLEDFTRFKRVISGHFHKHQIDSNLIYLGTPYSQSFGETDQHKFLMTYNHITNEYTLMEPKFPRHVTIKLDLLQDKAKQTLEQFLEANKDNVIRVQLYGPSEICAKFNDKYRPLYDSTYNVKFEDKSEGVNLEATLDETLDNKTQFVQWAHDIKKLDPETIKLGLSILEALGAK